tara:strand:- start:12872 stop:14089 length:1218 start_codon:yes stop_codon:yes gene_type:complete
MDKKDQEPEDNERKANQSMLDYYVKSGLNPDKFLVEDEAIWKLHYKKRLNLYQKYLKIPFAFLKGASVLEFGCNSGENSLVLASAGANLTLVEPNKSVHERLKYLFKKFGFEKNMILHSKTIEDFNPDKIYDLIMIEGFLFSLPNRNEMVLKIGKLLSQNGLGIISFMDRYGGLIEFTKKYILARLCKITGNKIKSEKCFEFAKRLYKEDFSNLNTSRDFKVWWDELVCGPSYKWHCLWSYPELLQLIEKSNCELYSTSPQWNTGNNFIWYKNISQTRQIHERSLDSWKENFSFFLTGFSPNKKDKPITNEIIKSVYNLIKNISNYSGESSQNIASYPEELDQYLSNSNDPLIIQFNLEMKNLYQTLQSSDYENIISTYLNSKTLRKSWGSLYHYICFRKNRNID